VLEGEPLGPPPAVSFRPIRVYSVKLPGGSRYSFHDDPVQLGVKSLVHEAGVSRMGVKIHKRPDIEELLTEAGITDDTERKVVKKIAEVESGFEAINTCDPNDVSVGFVPFAAGEAGEGPLCRLLRSMKCAEPREFEGSFRSLGIDVGEKGLTVVHPDHGRILRGREAVQAIRDDKRLTAVFQQAGEKSRAYQLAQLRLAQELYYLAARDFTLKRLVRAGDVHRGLGNAQQVFKEACTSVLQEKGITTLRALAEYEAFITPLIQPAGRIRVMEDRELSQPAVAPEL
jgi:hypothetical protein